MLIWDNHKATIIVALVLVLAVLMVMTVFLAPWLYGPITLAGVLLTIRRSRKVQYIGILLAVIGIAGLTVLDVNSLEDLRLIVAVVGGTLLFFVENPRPRSRSIS